MFFREHHTPPCLAPYIRYYWTLEAEAPPGPHSGQGQRFLTEGLEFTFNLSNLLGKNSRDDAAVNAAIDFIDYFKGRISVHGLARYLGMSCRNLERKFKERIGMTPKQLCRNIRFKHTYKNIEASPRDNWVDLALACGYYDQAHLINEFRYFTGTSPAEFFKSSCLMPDFFTANF